MNASDDTQDDISRRSFLLSSSGLFSSMWVAAHWPGIAAAAHHADQVSDAAPAHFQFFSAAEGADVEAVGAQIVPSGATQRCARGPCGVLHRSIAVDVLRLDGAWLSARARRIFRASFAPPTRGPRRLRPPAAISRSHS